MRRLVGWLLKFLWRRIYWLTVVCWWLNISLWLFFDIRIAFRLYMIDLWLRVAKQVIVTFLSLVIIHL